MTEAERPPIFGLQFRGRAAMLASQSMARRPVPDVNVGERKDMRAAG